MRNRSSKSGLTGIVLCIAAIIILRSIAPMLGRLLSTLLTIAVVGVLIFCGLIVYYALTGSGKDGGGSSAVRRPSQSDAKLMSEGRTALARLRTANLKIIDPQVKAKSENVCAIADRIMAALRRDPEKTPDAVQLLRYYLPQLAEIISRYTAMQQSADAAQTTEKLSAHLDTIASVMEKHYSALVSGDQINVSSDMEAMMQALRLDGLDPSSSGLPRDEAEMLAEKYTEGRPQ
ncbi:MAG: 5-bromo-4-chloroindolyl phosphate hydrolysis family protein [Firmicutes bacterium]|nr:5-bromo-4-chloroindolyl phosphate hydrolysis family protein [Bacillota bacterium]MBQ6260521.1 5-bromo-4-chloroindolyl phosphate hydrolysis family protein [Bacillota bacterium]MBR0114675.1 5-bromo-4-chloroindolyl phosphate hydrolysis family protein [Bacillota bacterium]